MVVRSEEEHFTPETEKKDEAEATAGADAEKKADDKGDEETKVKKVLRRYFRTYFPAWKGSYKGRLYYEDFIEIKEPSSTAKAAETLLMTEQNDNDMGDLLTKKGPTAELKEENQVIYTSDNNCIILAMIIKGLKGDQHKVVMFNSENTAPLSKGQRAGNTDLEFNMNAHMREYTSIFIVQTEPNNSVSAK